MIIEDRRPFFVRAPVVMVNIAMPMVIVRLWA
jgi:hypothetical protein